MSHRARRTQFAAAVIVSIGALAACGGDDQGSGPTTTTTTQATSAPATEAEAAAAPEVEPTGVVVPVVALDNSFRPQQVEVHVGDTVEWENRGNNEHNVLTVEGDGWGVQVDDFQPGDVYTHVFTEPGDYAYYCSIHGNESVGMVGTVTVLP